MPEGHIIEDHIAINYCKNDKNDLVHFLTHIETGMRTEDLKNIVSPTAPVIFTSAVNAYILKVHFKYERNIVPIEMGKTYQIYTKNQKMFIFTCLRSYYNCGSMIIIARGDFGTLIYTGFSAIDFNSLNVRIIKDICRQKSLTHLYLDCTYYQSSLEFFSITDIKRVLVQFFRVWKNQFYIHVPVFGLEDLLGHIAMILQEVMVVDERRMELIENLGLSHYFTLDKSKGRLHVISQGIMKKDVKDGTSQLVHINVINERSSNSNSYMNYGKIHFFTIYPHCTNKDCNDIIANTSPDNLIPLRSEDSESLSKSGESTVIIKRIKSCLHKKINGAQEDESNPKEDEPQKDLKSKKRRNKSSESLRGNVECKNSNFSLLESRNMEKRPIHSTSNKKSILPGRKNLKSCGQFLTDGGDQRKSKSFAQSGSSFSGRRRKRRKKIRSWEIIGTSSSSESEAELNKSYICKTNVNSDVKLINGCEVNSNDFIRFVEHPYALPDSFSLNSSKLLKPKSLKRSLDESQQDPEIGTIFKKNIKNKHINESESDNYDSTSLIVDLAEASSLPKSDSNKHAPSCSRVTKSHEMDVSQSGKLKNELTLPEKYFNSNNKQSYSISLKDFSELRSEKNTEINALHILDKNNTTNYGIKKVEPIKSHILTAPTTDSKEKSIKESTHVRMSDSTVAVHVINTSLKPTDDTHVRATSVDQPSESPAEHEPAAKISNISTFKLILPKPVMSEAFRVGKLLESVSVELNKPFNSEAVLVGDNADTSQKLACPTLKNSLKDHDEGIIFIEKKPVYYVAADSVKNKVDFVEGYSDSKCDKIVYPTGGKINKVQNELEGIDKSISNHEISSDSSLVTGLSDDILAARQEKDKTENDNLLVPKEPASPFKTFSSTFTMSPGDTDEASSLKLNSFTELESNHQSKYLNCDSGLKAISPEVLHDKPLRQGLLPDIQELSSDEEFNYESTEKSVSVIDKNTDNFSNINFDLNKLNKKLVKEIKTKIEYAREDPQHSNEASIPKIGDSFSLNSSFNCNVFNKVHDSNNRADIKTNVRQVKVPMNKIEVAKIQDCFPSTRSCQSNKDLGLPVLGKSTLLIKDQPDCTGHVNSENITTNISVSQVSEKSPQLKYDQLCFPVSSSLLIDKGKEAILTNVALETPSVPSIGKIDSVGTLVSLDKDLQETSMISSLVMESQYVKIKNLQYLNRKIHKIDSNSRPQRTSSFIIEKEFSSILDHSMIPPISKTKHNPPTVIPQKLKLITGNVTLKNPMHLKYFPTARRVKITRSDYINNIFKPGNSKEKVVLKKNSIIIPSSLIRSQNNDVCTSNKASTEKESSNRPQSLQMNKNKQPSDMLSPLQLKDNSCNEKHKKDYELQKSDATETSKDVPLLHIPEPDVKNNGVSPLVISIKNGIEGSDKRKEPVTEENLSTFSRLKVKSMSELLCKTSLAESKEDKTFTEFTRQLNELCYNKIDRVKCDSNQSISDESKQVSSSFDSTLKIPGKISDHEYCKKKFCRPQLEGKRKKKRKQSLWVRNVNPRRKLYKQKTPTLKTNEITKSPSKRNSSAKSSSTKDKSVKKHVTFKNKADSLIGDCGNLDPDCSYVSKVVLDTSEVFTNFKKPDSDTTLLKEFNIFAELKVCLEKDLEKSSGYTFNKDKNCYLEKMVPCSCFQKSATPERKRGRPRKVQCPCGANSNHVPLANRETEMYSNLSISNCNEAKRHFTRDSSSPVNTNKTKLDLTPLLQPITSPNNSRSEGNFQVTPKELKKHQKSKSNLSIERNTFDVDRDSTVESSNNLSKNLEDLCKNSKVEDVAELPSADLDQNQFNPIDIVSTSVDSEQGVLEANSDSFTNSPKSLVACPHQPSEVRHIEAMSKKNISNVKINNKNATFLKEVSVDLEPLTEDSYTNKVILPNDEVNVKNEKSSKASEEVSKSTDKSLIDTELKMELRPRKKSKTPVPQLPPRKSIRNLCQQPREQLVSAKKRINEKGISDDSFEIEPPVDVKFKYLNVPSSFGRQRRIHPKFFKK